MLVNFFCRIYTDVNGISMYASFKRFVIRLSSNIFLPLSFIIFKKKIKRKVRDNDVKKIIVSLTSFPARINRVWLVIECILRQDVEADLIVLYLAKNQFPGREMDLPKKLRKYVDKNQLKINFVEDLRSHKKYFYSFQEYFNDIVILVDDDIYYPSYIISDLIQEYKKNPNCIICTRGYTVLKKETCITQYKEWELLKYQHAPSFRIFHTSGGGTLYTPSLFNEDIFEKDVFLKECRYADDVWLNIQAQRSNIQIVKTSGFIEILPILNSTDNPLKKYNVSQNGNDIQLQNLIDYYKLKEDSLFADKP